MMHQMDLIEVGGRIPPESSQKNNGFTSIGSFALVKAPVDQVGSFEPGFSPSMGAS